MQNICHREAYQFKVNKPMMNRSFTQQHLCIFRKRLSNRVITKASLDLPRKIALAITSNQLLIETRSSLRSLGKSSHGMFLVESSLSLTLRRLLLFSSRKTSLLLRRRLCLLLRRRLHPSAAEYLKAKFSCLPLEYSLGR